MDSHESAQLFSGLFQDYLATVTSTVVSDMQDLISRSCKILATDTLNDGWNFETGHYVHRKRLMLEDDRKLDLECSTEDGIEYYARIVAFASGSVIQRVNSTFHVSKYDVDASLLESDLNSLYYVDLDRLMSEAFGIKLS